jgi:hypothetical protein
MREHVVQPGDSPASLAILYAGCPKCARDLVRANPHKEAVTYPNGFVTFKDLREGEKLTLPEKWFSKEFEELPKAYFAALPHPDGVTPSKLGDLADGVLGDYAALDVASAKVGSLATMNDQPFSDAVSDAASAVDAAVREVVGMEAPAKYATPYVQDVRKSTEDARLRNVALAAAITAGDQESGFQSRNDILHDLSNALTSAKLALQAFYGDAKQPSDDVVVAAAKAAATVIASDSNFCVSVARSGSSVNSAVHTFKKAWNAANPTAPVPINTGAYEQATADAIKSVIGSAPAACVPHVAPSTPFSPPELLAVTPPQNKGLSTGTILSLGLLGAGAVGTAIYFAANSRPLVRREKDLP